MSRRPRNRSLPPPARKIPDPAAPPTLLELDSFSVADVRRWKRASEQFDELQRQLYFGLESQRVAHRRELLEALQGAAAEPFDFDGWVRMVDYQYALQPLSAAGSARHYGGRFNIGRDVGEGAFGSFAALYVAQDVETAYREYYQIETAAASGGLAREELALRRRGSVLMAELRGRVETVFDLGQLQSLAAFAKVISRFEMPASVRRLARTLGLKQAGLIRSASQLQRSLIFKNWRAWPVQFDVPANPQVFGRLLCDAGFEAVLYPSSKNGQCCLALFPQNIRRSGTFVELVGGYPHEVEIPRLDSTTAPACL